MKKTTTMLKIGQDERASAVESLIKYSGAPVEGILQRFLIDVPIYEYGTYYAAFQKYDVVPGMADKPTPYTDGANRIQPLRIESFAGLKSGGMFLLLKLKDGHTLAVLPLVCGQAAAWLGSGEGDRLELRLGTHGTAAVSGDIPLLAWARSEDPYAACRMVWEAALNHELLGQPARMREQKHYPELFQYLGWCSWEEYKRDINEEMLLRTRHVMHMRWRSLQPAIWMA